MENLKTVDAHIKSTYLIYISLIKICYCMTKFFVIPDIRNLMITRPERLQAEDDISPSLYLARLTCTAGGGGGGGVGGGSQIFKLPLTASQVHDNQVR
jgi:hypothetical protein